MNASMCRCSSRQKSSSSVAFGWSCPMASRTRRVSASESSGIGSSPTQVGHSSRARRAISARTSSYVAAARRSSSSGEIVALSACPNLRSYSSRPRRKSPCARGMRSSRSQSTNSSTSRGRLRRRRLDATAESRVIELGRHLSRRSAEVRDAGHRRDRLLDVKGGDLATATGAQVRAGGVEDVADPLHAAGRARKSSLQRCELAAEEAEEPAAKDVGIADRRPRQLVEVLLLESQLVDDPEQDAPIDLLLAAEPSGRLQARAGLGQPLQSGLVPASVRSGQRSSCSWLPASVACTG